MIYPKTMDELKAHHNKYALEGQDLSDTLEQVIRKGLDARATQATYRMPNVLDLLEKEKGEQVNICLSNCVPSEREGFSLVTVTATVEKSL